MVLLDLFCAERVPDEFENTKLRLLQPKAKRGMCNE